MIERLEQQKRLTSNQWKLICTANVADLLDFFDFFLIGFWVFGYEPKGRTFEEIDATLDAPATAAASGARAPAG